MFNLPEIFRAPIRTDIVQLVHKNMAKNKRQPYAVSRKAGHKTSAVSWGTGRAVSRIPRVSGGGTGRAGQAAYGNMCRGGRMFAPTKVWRRWHVRTNIKMRRAAVAACVAASGVPAIVTARGHRIEKVAELPLVVAKCVAGITTTKSAKAFLQAIGAYDDVKRVMDSKKLRAGKGKMRNRRTTQRRGPLIVYNSDQGITRAFRNLPGVDLCCVHRLNLLQLAPGGHMGRFVIWLEDAFEVLDEVYAAKVPRCAMLNADLARLINSQEIQAVVKPIVPPFVGKQQVRKLNPLRNKELMMKLNPYAKARISALKERICVSKAKGKAAPAFVAQLLAH